jgi:hypothetical protein
MGVPCRLYFRVNMNALVKLLGEAGEELPFSQDGGNAHPGMAEPDPPACPKTPNKDVQTEQAIEEDREYYTRDYNRESVSQATTQRGKSSSTSHAGRGTGRRGTEASRKSNNLEQSIGETQGSPPSGRNRNTAYRHSSYRSLVVRLWGHHSGDGQTAGPKSINHC